jgi:hypothetical protein
MAKTSDAQLRAVAKYNKENTKNVVLHLNILTDKDVLDYLYRKENKTGYIKELIREDMKKNP